MMTRQVFEFQAGDTGTVSKTGPSAFGRVRQMRWNPTAAVDTGCDLQLAVLPRQNDTGDGWIAYSKANVLGSDFLEVNDTGLTKTFLAGDRLRATAINSGGVGTAVQGRLYVYVENDR